MKKWNDYTYVAFLKCADPASNMDDGLLFKVQMQQQLWNLTFKQK